MRCALFVHGGIVVGFCCATSLFTFEATYLLARCRLTLLRFIFAQRDCHWIPMGLWRDCQKLALGMRSDWWPWLICTEGLPLDYLGAAEGLSTDRLGNAERLADRRGIAFGLPLGLPLDWRKMGIAKGLPTVCQWNTLGLCRDSLGISLGLPKFCQGVTSGLTRDCLICGPGFYRHRPKRP